MLEEVMPELYKIEVPLPQNPLKATNSYVILGNERNLIIDTGMNREECQNAMTRTLTELQVDLAKTDFFITHLHADHLGLVSELATASSRIYFNQPDAKSLENLTLWEDLYSSAQKHGFPEDTLRSAMSGHPGKKYGPTDSENFVVLQEGERLEFADFRLHCVHTPGHTLGHMCLYDEKKKLLFSGDHILKDITPNITSWDDARNPLKMYLESLNKVHKLEVSLVLPGHRSFIYDCKQRINELIEHHRTRLEEIITILEDFPSGSASAIDVASRMSWDLVSESWDAFPVMQKWFATGEALAHLIYLQEKGLVNKEIKSGKVFFALNS